MHANFNYSHTCTTHRLLTSQIRALIIMTTSFSLKCFQKVAHFSHLALAAAILNYSFKRADLAFKTRVLTFTLDCHLLILNYLTFLEKNQLSV